MPQRAEGPQIWQLYRAGRYPSQPYFDRPSGGADTGTPNRHLDTPNVRVYTKVVSQSGHLVEGNMSMPVLARGLVVLKHSYACARAPVR